MEKIKKYIENRIEQLKSQLDNPDVLDQKRVEIKLEAYQEMRLFLKYNPGQEGR